MNTPEKDIKILNITGTDVSKEDRLIEDHEKLKWVIEFFKKEGKRIGYTMGAYDIKHVGHDRYLQNGKERVDILIVGLDSDEFIRETKGPDRPVVSYDERAEALMHNRSVNIVTILRTQKDNDELVQKIKPHVIILSHSSAKKDRSVYEEQMKEKYGPFCEEVVILEPQAETSTTARIRTMVIGGATKLVAIMKKCSDDLKTATEEFFNLNGGTK